MRRLQGGVATPVRVVSNRKLQKGAAIPVYVVTNRKYSGGIATPVYVVDSTHKIQGGEAIPVYEASDGEIESGAAIPVYVVEGVLGASPIVAPWYLPNGIVLSDVVAAYAAKGAASYAASKINLANPGTYNLTEVATSLNWDAILGWNDANKALTSSGFLLTNFTFIIKFSGIVEFGGCGYIPASLYSVIDSEYGLITCRDIGEGGPYAVRYGSDTYNAIVEPDLLQGTIAFTNNHTTNKMQGYRNGVADGTLFDTDVSGVDTLFIMNYPNYEEVQSIALYNKVLTQSQIQEVGANMP